MASIYLIGSLRNSAVPKLAASLRNNVTEVFDNWYAAGKIADDSWRDYERSRGHDYQQALDNHSARHTYSFDLFHLNRCHAGILCLPAGRSGHLEAGFVSGQGKPVFMLLDKSGEPERLDVLSQVLYGVYSTVPKLQVAIDNYPWPKLPEIPFLTVLDAVWLAGILEGEGSFCISGGTPRLVLQMTDYDIVKQAANIIGSRVWKHPRAIKGHKDIWACGRAGLTAIEWMRILMPYLGIRRQEQIRTTAKQWLNKRIYHQQDRNWWLRMFNLQDIIQRN